MKRPILLIPLLLLFAATSSHAWDVKGHVVCDTQPNGYFDELDEPFPGVGVIVEVYPSGELEGSKITDAMVTIL